MVTIAESQFALPATAPALSLIKEAKAHPGFPCLASPMNLL